MKSGVTVELDAFSGRPNPVWTLSARDVSELASMLSALVGGGQGAPPAGLGYRGFVVRGAAQPPGQDRIVVSGGLVFAGPGRVLRDPDRTVERWLARRVMPRADADVQRLLAAQGLL